MEEDYLKCPFQQCRIRHVGCETSRDCDIILKLKKTLKKVLKEKKVIYYSDKDYIELKEKIMKDKITPLSESEFKELEDEIVHEYLKELRGE